MYKAIISCIILLVPFASYSQDATSYYSEAVTYFDSEDYTLALQKFQLANTSYKRKNEVLKSMKCLSYIVKIHSLQSNYKASVTKSNDALDYFKDSKITNDSLYSEIISTKILSLKSLGKFKEAYKVSSLLIKYLNAKKETKKYLANAYQIKSRVEVDLGNYDDAIISAKRALLLNTHKNQERKAALLNIVGVGYYFKEELDSASYYYNESYKIKRDINADNYQLAIAVCNIGIVQELLGEYDNAIALYNKAVKYDLLDRGEEVGILHNIYVGLANTYFKKNDLEKAEEFANKALRIALKRFGEDSPETSFVYVAYSNIFELKGDYKKNIEYTQKALDIRRKTYGDKHRWTAESLMSIGESHIELQEFEAATKKYNEVIAIAKAINNKLVEAYGQMGLGTIYNNTKEYQQAMVFLNMAKTNFLNTYGNYHGTHFRVLVLEAENYFKQGEIKQALKIIDEIKVNATDSKLFYHLDALTLQFDIALHNFNTRKDTSLLEKSLDEIDDAIALLLKIRNDYPTSKSKIYVNNSMDDFLAKAVEASFILYLKTKNKTYLEKGFKLSELNRSSALVGGIKEVRFKKMANVPATLLSKENTLNRKLAILKKELYYEENEEIPDTDYLNELLSKQLNCRKTLDSLLKKIEIQYPKYYQLKYSEKDIDLTMLQSTILKEDETIVEYFLGHSYLYSFIITKSQIQFKKLGATNKVITAIHTFRAQLSNQEDLTKTSKALYKLLFQDLNLNTSRVIIIPDKELNHLPFEAIMHGDKYLIEAYTISYSGSSSLITTQQDDFFDVKLDTHWSGFAPEYTTNTTLTANQEEVNTVSKLMKGAAFLGKDASISNFKNQAQNSSILHLATHAEIDHNDPLYNKLIFAKDSVLTASDIYTLPINADLTVLSACETGFGKLEKSEGVMSMSRAFQYAGVKSTMMSLWKIPDQETSKLIVSFYKYLNKGMHKDEALQKAKIDYLKSIDDVALKHPYYWSGLIISGDVSPIKTSFNLWLIVGVLLSLVALAFVVKHLIKLFK